MSVRTTLLGLLLGPAIAYFSVIAWRPDWLVRPWLAGSSLTWSVILALSLIWYGFLVTLLYTLLLNRTASRH